MKTHLVVGHKGQIGSAVMALLCEKFPTAGVDIGTRQVYGPFGVIHICIPFSDSFLGTVADYQKEHGSPECLTIIHSTVPLGTSGRLGAVHSPVRGVHPHLLEGLRTFVKYFGGPRAEEAASIFAQCGLVCRPVKSARDTEAMKLWDTTQYGLNIVLEKAIHAYCQEHGLDFETVYTDANRTYNEGFKKLGMERFAKYNLEHVPGQIGGHCVLPNCELLGGEIAEFVSTYGKVPA